MKVSIDNVWASPTMLHVRVTTWSDNGQRWHKYHASSRLEDIEPDAIKALQAYAAGVDSDSAWEDLALF